jgi:hypothetical protein
MIVKPSIAFLTLDPDALLINDCRSIMATMTVNVAIYATPSPAFTVIKPAVDDFELKVEAAVSGGTALKALKNDARVEVCRLMRLLASYVQMECGNILANLLLSGFTPQKTGRTPIGLLPTPANVTLTLGIQSGSLDAAVTPIYGAAAYNWELFSATPGVTTAKMQSTAASVTFTGLVPGTIYSLRANAVGAAGVSDWGVSSSQMVV